MTSQSPETYHEQGSLGSDNHLCCGDPLLLPPADPSYHSTPHLQSIYMDQVASPLNHNRTRKISLILQVRNEILAAALMPATGVRLLSQQAPDQCTAGIFGGQWCFGTQPIGKALPFGRERMAQNASSQAARQLVAAASMSCGAHHCVGTHIQAQDVHHVLCLNALLLALEGLCLHERVQLWVRLDASLLFHPPELHQLTCSSRRSTGHSGRTMKCDTHNI